MTRSETPPRLPALIPGGPSTGHAGHRPRPRHGSAEDAGYAAQAIGQEGVRRGLRGGAPVLAAARTAYLSTEWSGAGDRRTSPGAIRRTTA